VIGHHAHSATEFYQSTFIDSLEYQLHIVYMAVCLNTVLKSEIDIFAVFLLRCRHIQKW